MAQSPVERVLTFRYPESPAGMQHADIQDAVLDGPARTITLRGPADLVSTAEWFFRQLERPAPSGGAGPDVQESRPARWCSADSIGQR